MIAGKYNLNIDQGATFERSFSVKNPDGTPFDFAGYQARMQIRPEVDSDTIDVELTTENGRITFGENGTFQIMIPSSVTELMRHEGVYDLELLPPSGKVYRLIKGLVRVDLEVTR